jgi:hypothetical protein
MPNQKKNSLQKYAALAARKGRGGDTMLAHINPAEASLLKAHGGSGTINPDTGLPEFMVALGGGGGGFMSDYSDFGGGWGDFGGGGGFSDFGGGNYYNYEDYGFGGGGYTPVNDSFGYGDAGSYVAPYEPPYTAPYEAPPVINGPYTPPYVDTYVPPYVPPAAPVESGPVVRPADSYSGPSQTFYGVDPSLSDTNPYTTVNDAGTGPGSPTA